MRRIAILTSVMVAAASTASAATVTEVHYVMGTYFRITADGVDEASTRAAVRRCFATTRALDEQFSRFKPQSELSRLNATADDGAPVPISTEMAALLDAAIRLRAATAGAFDVGAGALTQLWRTTAEWPRPERIAEAQRTTGEGAFAVVGTTLHRHAGVVIDLDGIAKGYAVDRCVAQLRSDAVARALLSFGESSLYALGAPAGSAGWEITVRDADGRHALGTLRVRDRGISVSSVLGHEHQIGSRHVGHIVDPRTGLPLVSPALAVVVASSATDAEAFSKALLIERRIPRGAARSRGIAGAVIARGTHVERVGRIDFTPSRKGRLIPAVAEPLQ